MSKGKYKALNEALERPDRTPDHHSKRGVPYWWAPEWVRDLYGTVCRVVPLKKSEDNVDLHLVSKEGNLTYVQGSIQTEFRSWHEDRQIDYILLGVDEDQLLTPEWVDDVT